MNGDPRSFSATLAVIASLFALAWAGAAAAQRPADKPTPSGLPVPRWVSLKFDKVNARAGPGDDHRALWVWRARGLPLQVVAETREWRKVCGPDRKAAWVHRRTVDGERRALNRTSAPLALLVKPKPGAKPRAWLVAGGGAELDRCEKGWCLIKAADQSGWAAETSLWGATETAQCR